MSYRISEAGIEFIKRQEGFRSKAYWDVKQWSVGYGTGGPGIGKNTVVTKAQADALLRQRVRLDEKAVNASVRRPMTQGQFDSMVSMSYNIGYNRIGKTQTVRHFNAGNIEKAANSFYGWTNAGGKRNAGLVKRRGQERSMFLTGSVGAGVGAGANSDRPGQGRVSPDNILKTPNTIDLRNNVNRMRRRQMNPYGDIPHDAPLRMQPFDYSTVQAPPSDDFELHVPSDAGSQFSAGYKKGFYQRTAFGRFMNQMEVLADNHKKLTQAGIYSFNPDDIPHKRPPLTIDDYMTVLRDNHDKILEWNASNPESKIASYEDIDDKIKYEQAKILGDYKSAQQDESFLGKASLMAGEVVGYLTDPINTTSVGIPFGAGVGSIGKSTSKVANALKVALAEGSINAGLEAIHTPGQLELEKSLGEQIGEGDAGKQIAIGAGIGFAAGLAIPGGAALYQSAKGVFKKAGIESAEHLDDTIKTAAEVEQIKAQAPEGTDPDKFVQDVGKEYKKALTEETPEIHSETLSKETLDEPIEEAPEAVISRLRGSEELKKGTVELIDEDGNVLRTMSIGEELQTIDASKSTTDLIQKCLLGGGE